MACMPEITNQSLSISDLREPFIAELTNTALIITAPKHFTTRLYNAIIEGIELWDESELIG